MGNQKNTPQDGEQYVMIKLFKDGARYKDDVFVAVNGEGCLIKRGESVMVKQKFAEVLEQSDRQDLYATQLMEERAGQFDRDSRLMQI